MAHKAAITSFFLPLFITVSLISQGTNGTITTLSQNNNKRLDNKSIKVKSISRLTGQESDSLGVITLWASFYTLYESSTVDHCSWSWIECNTQDRVVSLFLGSLNLYGSIPDFSTMDALEYIDLSRNRFFGFVPSFLGEFTNLGQLNLSYNQFTGQLPSSLVCNTKLNLTVVGNPNLSQPSRSCSSFRPPTNSGSPPSFQTPSVNDFPTYTTSKKKKSNVPSILGGTISAFAILWIAVGIFLVFRHRAKTTANFAADQTNHSSGVNNVAEKAGVTGTATT